MPRSWLTFSVVQGVGSLLIHDGSVADTQLLLDRAAAVNYASVHGLRPS
jgi:hypothetical protein